jgi:hypothetical protein
VGCLDGPSESELYVLGEVEGLDVLELGCDAARWSISLASLGARPVEPRTCRLVSLSTSAIHGEVRSQVPLRVAVGKMPPRRR